MRKLLVAGAGVAALVSAGCATTSQEVRGAAPHTPAETAATAQNPLLARWSGPYGGVPPFDQIKLEHFKPALEAAIEEYRRELAEIANDPAAPTFENTLAALEAAGRTYDDVLTVYRIWGSSLSGPEFQAVQRELAPRIAAFSDEITQNEKLFQRLEAVYTSPEKAKLTPEQQRLTWLRYTSFAPARTKFV